MKQFGLVVVLAACCCTLAVRADDDELSLEDDSAELKVDSKGAPDKAAAAIASFERIVFPPADWDVKPGKAKRNAAILELFNRYPEGKQVELAERLLKEPDLAREVKVAAWRAIAFANETTYGVWTSGFQARYVQCLPAETCDRMQAKALEAFAALVTDGLEPDSLGIRLRYLRALMFAEKWDEALAQSEAALAIKPPEKADDELLRKRALAWYHKAECQFAKGDRKAAFATLREFLAAIPSLPSRRGALDPTEWARAALFLAEGDPLNGFDLPVFTGAKAYPEPQKAEYSETFQPLAKIRIKTGGGVKPDDARVRLVRNKFAAWGIPEAEDAAFTVDIALDPSVKPERPEAYVLETTAKGATIRGRDKLGVLWGVVSFIQLLDRGKKAVRLAKLNDWPGSLRRGYFHSGSVFPQGPEFSAMTKASFVCYQSDPTSDNRYSPINRYIMSEIAHLFRDLGIEFFYGCDWVTESPQLPVCKPTTFPFRVEVMKRYAKEGAGFYYRLDDVRFPVIPEDLAAYGSAAAFEPKHINDLFLAVRKEYPDFKLILCPPFYWGPDSRAHYPEPRDAYLEAIGREMHPDILICWTGGRVKSYGIKPHQVKWMADRIKRKPMMCQNATGVHNLLNYVVDTTYWQSWYYPNQMENDMASYTKNSHQPGEVTQTATVCDFLWNRPAYERDGAAENSVRRATGMLMGEKMYDILEPPLEGLAYLDKYRYGVVSSDVRDEDPVKIRAIRDASSNAWARAKAYNPAAVARFCFRYGQAVGFAEKVLAAVDKTPDFAAAAAGEIRTIKNLAAYAAKYSEERGDILLSPVSFRGSRAEVWPPPIPERQKNARYIVTVPPGATVTASFSCETFPVSDDYAFRICTQADGANATLAVTVNGKPAGTAKPARDYRVQKLALTAAALARNNTLAVRNTGKVTVRVNYAVVSPPEDSKSLEE